MDAGTVSEIVEAVIKTKVHILITNLIFAGVILMLLKIVAEAVSGYIMFRSDMHICIGSPVEVYGKKGRIVEAGFFAITIETECGFIRVPTKDWRSSKYLILKDSMVLRNRRSEDIKKECEPGTKK